MQRHSLQALTYRQEIDGRLRQVVRELLHDGLWIIQRLRDGGDEAGRERAGEEAVDDEEDEVARVHALRDERQARHALEPRQHCGRPA